ncbi:MAG: DciA family protein [Pseudomonadota bacterium]
MASPKGELSYPQKRTKKGFQRTGSLLAARVRKAGESRGFAETRLLTQWAEIVGAEVASVARPVKVGYARKGGLGATLTLLVKGASAPLVQMQLPRIRERVNAAYGYSAISRIHITQTAPTGFADAQTPYEPPKKSLSDTETARLTTAVNGVDDAGLKSALETLGRNVLTKAKS